MRFYFIVVDTFRELSLFLALLFSCVSSWLPFQHSSDYNGISLSFLAWNSVIMATWFISSV